MTLPLAILIAGCSLAVGVVVGVIARHRRQARHEFTALPKEAVHVESRRFPPEEIVW